MTEPIDIISLGAGVQSSTMLLMAVLGLILPLPIAAIFADTQAEPLSVYKWLNFLCGVEVKFRADGSPYVEPGIYRGGIAGHIIPIHIVTQGSLVDDTLTIRQRKDGKGEWSPSGVPHFSVNPDGSYGQGNRQCTGDFKIVPLMREQRRILKDVGQKSLTCWIGISIDEVQRMKDSRVGYIKHRWPLIEMGMKRQNCLKWMEAKAFPTPPRSACVFCPYHSNREWRRLRDEEPEEFQRAIQFEKDYQAVKKKTLPDKAHFVPYLHTKRIPLAEVDFSTEEERGQLNMFNNECEGMCGV